MSCHEVSHYVLGDIRNGLFIHLSKFILTVVIVKTFPYGVVVKLLYCIVFLK